MLSENAKLLLIAKVVASSRIKTKKLLSASLTIALSGAGQQLNNTRQKRKTQNSSAEIDKKSF